MVFAVDGAGIGGVGVLDGQAVVAQAQAQVRHSAQGCWCCVLVAGGGGRECGKGICMGVDGRGDLIVSSVRIDAEARVVVWSSPFDEIPAALSCSSAGVAGADSSCCSPGLTSVHSSSALPRDSSFSVPGKKLRSSKSDIVEEQVDDGVRRTS